MRFYEPTLELKRWKTFCLEFTLSVFIRSPVWSVLSLVFQYPVMVQLHKASLVEPSCHSRKMFDLLDLTVSKDLIREWSSSVV